MVRIVSSWDSVCFFTIRDISSNENPTTTELLPIEAFVIHLCQTKSLAILLVTVTIEGRSSSSWNSEQSSSYNTIAFNVVSNRSPRLCSITWCSSASDSIHRMLSSRLWICLMVDGIKDFSMAHKRQSYIDRCSGQLHYQPTRSFLVPIELYSLRPSITFIIYAAIFTEHVLHHVIRPRW